MSSNTDHALSGVIAEQLERLLEGITHVVTDNQTAMKQFATQRGSSSVFETLALVLSPGFPVPFAGYDLSRKQITLNTKDDQVYIGHLSQLAGGFGFLVPANAPTVIKTTDDVYAVYLGDTNATLFGFVEKTAN